MAQGDLPNLQVAADGTATVPVMNHQLAVAELAGHPVMIHAVGASAREGIAAVAGPGPSGEGLAIKRHGDCQLADERDVNNRSKAESFDPLRRHKP
jgi:hypothetical protein